MFLVDAFHVCFWRDEAWEGDVFALNAAWETSWVFLARHYFPDIWVCRATGAREEDVALERRKGRLTELNWVKRSCCRWLLLRFFFLLSPGVVDLNRMEDRLEFVVRALDIVRIEIVLLAHQG